jgi:hypothetical protein
MWVSSMSDQNWLDNALVAYTDDLLSGVGGPPPSDLGDVVPVLHALRDLAGPDVRPPGAFQARLRQRLGVQWSREVRRAPRSNRRLLWAGAGAALGLALVVLIVTAWDASGEDLQGTALGPVTGAIALVAVAGAALILWLGQRR